MKNIDKWKIPLYKIFTDEEDLKIVSRVIKSGKNWAIGKEIEEFEKEFAKFVSADYCVTVNSGTSALHAALLAYNVSNNDQVVVPSFSFIATANSVLFVRAKPIFSDIEKETYGIDPDDVERKINSKTKAIIPMDFGGNPCKILDIKNLAQEKNVIVIEDAAEALGASINGKKIGSISNSTVFSFAGNKVLTTGEGGAIVTNSRKIYEKMKQIRSHGRTDDKKYFNSTNKSEYYDLGYNWRMSSITAALGLTQLKKLDKMICMRQRNAKYISDRIVKFKNIKIPNVQKNCNHTFQFYTITLSNNLLRDKLHSFLTKKRIFSKVYFYPIHLTKFYQKKFRFIKKTLPITEQISERVLTLPMYPNMELEERKYIVNSVSEFFENKH